ncbi:PIN domain-containing protein [Sulfurisphaera tokodaii]|uniref:PIN domain protein n=2 Tax=Sulfurisphaera tokodaii TaxID=111955 RepID=Q970F0_SULTO|nr:PIN domain-containing protein [Sulfurisphaera tokodaii]BAB66723.1 PIN domain protein [Sulfurisphaera tokodaii str. 7]HII74213.1 type II toxin-antitoxin system VapC family toxin [Sulfurisphaera tokodaii]
MRVVVDTGVLVEVLEGSELGEKFIQLVSRGKLEPIITNLTLIELTYVICRRYGTDKARELIMKLLDSGYFKLVNALDFADEIVKVKCNNSLSIIDASVIATAKGLGITALFKMEKELKDKKIDNLIFIENLINI